MIGRFDAFYRFRQGARVKHPQRGVGTVTLVDVLNARGKPYTVSQLPDASVFAAHASDAFG